MIEHTDALGRTSYITKNELQAQVRKDKEISDLRRDEYDERYSRYSGGSRSVIFENKIEKNNRVLRFEKWLFYLDAYFVLF